MYNVRADLQNMFGDAQNERADDNHARYSEAYNMGVKGEVHPSVYGLDSEAKAATELGYKRGMDTQKMLDRVNGQDPSKDFLNRSYHQRHKWSFHQS